MQYATEHTGMGRENTYMHEKLWLLKWSWKAQNIRGGKKTFSGWIYFNNYDVFKEFPDYDQKAFFTHMQKGQRGRASKYKMPSLISAPHKMIKT